MAVCCPSWRGDKSPFPIKSNELYYSSAFRNAKASGLSREKQQTLHTWIHSNCDISNYQCNYYNLTISLQSRRPELFKTNKKDTARNPWQFAHLKWRNSISPQLLPQIVVKYKFSMLFSNTFFSFHRNKSKTRKDMGVCASLNALLWNSVVADYLAKKPTGSFGNRAVSSLPVSGDRNSVPATSTTSNNGWLSTESIEDTHTFIKWNKLH